MVKDKARGGDEEGKTLTLVKPELSFFDIHRPGVAFTWTSMFLP